MARLFALVDCNNFYASCERVFQPALRGRPVVVLSNNDGCVIARSNEAKALGIEMGAPWHLYRRRFEEQGVVVRSSNYTLYGDMSARVMRILADFTPELEIYSIDEAFLDLRGIDQLEAHVQRLRATVSQWTGIPVSVGVAPTKLLAKVANRLAKKTPAANGFLALADEASQIDALSRFALTDLWGVAARMAKRYTAEGIRTPLDLRAADPQDLRTRFGVVTQRLALELRGIPCLPLELLAPDRKSIVASRSFGQALTLQDQVAEAVSAFASRAAIKLRRQGLATAHLSVFLETNPFREQDPQYMARRGVPLPVATADTAQLIAAAHRALGAIWRNGYRYKKAGVMLVDLVKAAGVGDGLFDRRDDPRSLARMRTLDALNARFGRDAVTFGRTRERRPWLLRSEMLSRRYTTDWDELLAVG
jgi:DNA polymerase V